MNLQCEYLVTGAGAASLAFIDTLLTELPSTKVILIDRNAAPGGHWVHDYDYVKLHQPSLLYGVASMQLEGNWLKCVLGTGTLPWNHRATKEQILHYFQRFVDEKVASGQLEYYPECEYDFGKKFWNVGKQDTHQFTSLDGKMKYHVKVSEKLVNGVLGECKVPSQCPVQFPVNKDIAAAVITPNMLYDIHQEQSSSANKPSDKKYVVLGAGKTAMDTIVYLLRTMKINPNDLSWVVPNDVWMIAREGTGGPYTYSRALLDAKGDVDKACRSLEEKGTFVRLDKNVQPTRFRFPVIGKDELKVMRKVPNIIRKGRVTSIRKKGDAIEVRFSDDQKPMFLSPSDGEHVFVHCTSPGPFNGNEIDELFVSDKELRLFLLFAPPVSISLSLIAKLEAQRRLGALDNAFGTELLRAGSFLRNEDIADQDILHYLIRSFRLNGTVKQQLISLTTLAVFLTVTDKDPMVPYQWMKKNRLSFFAIPGFKSGIVDDLAKLVHDGQSLGFKENEIKMFQLLHKKLEPLKGI